MLTDPEREKIKLEEFYRAEVRLGFQDAAKEGSATRWWAFINSSFGLWVLTALFLPCATALYSVFRDHRVETIRNRDDAERLDIEISSRFSQILVQLYDLTDKEAPAPSLLAGRSQEDVKRVLSQLRDTRGDKFEYIYPEYSSRGLPALLADLSNRLEGEPKHQVQVALAELRGGRLEEGDLNDVRSSASRILQFMRKWRPNWKDTYFFFVNCPPESPFC